MSTIQHPMWAESKVPPGLLDKLNRLPSEERRLYLSERIANYYQSVNNLEAIAKKNSQRWLQHQNLHLTKVINELEDMMLLELGKETAVQRDAADGSGK